MRTRSPEKGEQQGEIAEINVVPLGDVSLVLLIALMTIMPMVMQSMIKVVASKAVSAASDDKVPEKPLYVEIERDALRLNNVPMNGDEDFFLRLRGEISRKSDKTVLVTAKPDVTQGRVVDVLDISKLAGAEKLSLVKHRAAP